MEIQRIFRSLEFIRQQVGNITVLQAQTLLAVVMNPGISQQELVDMFGTTYATVSRNLHKLSERPVQDPKTRKFEQVEGFLRILTDADDGRRVVIKLNKKGEELKRSFQTLR